MQAFIVRPFGTQGGIDFDFVHHKLIAPALLAAGIAGGTTGNILEAGNIRDDMFQLLLLADLVIADISIHNANVFYELGIRHALRGRQTYLIRAKVTKPKEQRDRGDEVPFDLKTDRYLEYDAADPALMVDTLIQGLEQTKVANKPDSPVFRSLPELVEPDRSKLTPVPQGFINEAEIAASKRQGGKLGLMGRESGRFVWEMGGRRLVGRHQFSCKFHVSAKETWNLVKSTYPDDLEANKLLGTIHQRLGDLTSSDQCLGNVLKNPQARSSDRAEALALCGRNAKTQARELFAGKDEAGRRKSAVLSGLFLQAMDYYRRAYEQDLNHFYSGLNALSLSVLMLDLIRQERDTWLGTFDEDEQALRREEELKKDQQHLVASVGLALAATEKKPEAQDDIWVIISRADYLFLTSGRDSAVAAAYARALGKAQDFAVSSARDQLDLFGQLNVRTERVNLCLQRFPVLVAPAPPLRQTILFTGHMVDAVGRKEPRFPASCEGKAREEILREVRQLLDSSPGPAIGIAGGANGGDILFHEVCQELGVPTRVLLTLPEGPFIAESVAPGDSDWVKRFNALMASHGGTNAVQVLGPSKDMPDWIRNQKDYDVWQRTNIWILEEALASGAREMALVALWDGKGGDGPGGTKDLVEQARRHGVNVKVLNTTALF